MRESRCGSLHRALPARPSAHAFLAPCGLLRGALPCSRHSRQLGRALSAARRPRPRMSVAAGGAAALLPRLGRSAVCNVALYALARGAGQRALTADGLKHALFLGVSLGFFLGAWGWGLCALFFAVGTSATRVGRTRKERLGIAEARGGARAPANVWGAAAVAWLCALLALLAEVGANDGAAALARVMYVCAVAAKMSDTLASEIGKAYGRDAFLVTTLRRVKPGTEGAVSVEGTLAGVAGSVVAAAYGSTTGLLPGGWAPAVVVVLAAFVATTAESYIGVLVQGQLEISNEFVNFLNTLIAALVGAVMWAALVGVG